MARLGVGTDDSMQLPPDDPRLMSVRRRADLLGAGHSDRSIRAEVRAGRLHRVRRGAYTLDARWPTLGPSEQHAIRARAAAVQAATDVVLSHVSALTLLDAPTWGFDLGDVHLTRLDQRSGRTDAGVRQHGGVIRAGDVVAVGDVAVMAPLRAALEVATLGSVEAALVVVNHFLHRGEVTLDEIESRYEQDMQRWPGALGTQLVLRLADGALESVGESRTSYRLWRSGLPRPMSQFEVYDGPTLIARLDFAWPDLGVWLEFDGRVKYEQFRRPGESVADAVIREKRREELIAEITGWRCVRITWADLADPKALVMRIRRAIAAAAAQRGGKLA